MATKVVNMISPETHENVLHKSKRKKRLISLVASEFSVKNSHAIAGNRDMTLFEIIELLLTRTG